jgi:hypothetical protein
VNNRSKKSSGAAVFCLAGLGLGNATRAQAIIEELAEHEPKLDIMIFTWGKSYTHFSNLNLNIQLVELVPYIDPSKESIYSGSLFAKIPRFFFIYLKNSFRIFKVLAKRKLAVAILDSDFHIFPFVFLRVPIISISQAPFVVSVWRGLKKPDWKFTLWFRFILLEWLESIVVSVYSTVVLVPSLERFLSPNTYIRSIELLVRRKFLYNDQIQKHSNEVGLIRSGSGLYAADLEKFRVDFGWKDLTELSWSLEQPSILAHTEIIATQAGLSSISECIALKKKMLVFPIPFHPEQFVNSAVLMRLGLAIECDLREDRRSGDSIFAKIEALKGAVPNIWPGVHGAKQAAEIVMNFMK